MAWRAHSENAPRRTRCVRPARARAAPRTFLNLDRGIDDLEDALRRRPRPLQDVTGLRNRTNGTLQPPPEAAVGKERAKGEEIAPLHDEPGAETEHNEIIDESEDGDDGKVGVAELARLDAGLIKKVGPLVEGLLLRRLACEGLRHLDTREPVLYEGADVTQLFADTLINALHAEVVFTDKNESKREWQDRRRSHDGTDPQDHPGHSDEGHDLLEQTREALENGLLHRIDVARDARDELAGAGVAVVVERLGFELRKELAAQIANDSLTRLFHEVGMHRIGPRPDEVGAEHDSQPHPQRPRSKGLFNKAVGDISPDEGMEVHEGNRKDEQAQRNNEPRPIRPEPRPDTGGQLSIGKCRGGGHGVITAIRRLRLRYEPDESDRLDLSAESEDSAKAII